MRTRPASIATVVIAIGLALTTIGIARALPYTVGGVGDRATVAADAWAHGSAVSPALVALVFLGILGVVTMRPTRGGRRAAAWLAVLAGAMLVAGLVEPAQQALVLFGTADLALTPLVYAFHLGLIALILSAVGEARRSEGAAMTRPGAGPEAAASAPASVSRLASGAAVA
jgi:hypothetical protein